MEEPTRNGAETGYENSATDARQDRMMAIEVANPFLRGISIVPVPSLSAGSQDIVCVPDDHSGQQAADRLRDDCANRPSI